MPRIGLVVVQVFPKQPSESQIPGKDCGNEHKRFEVEKKVGIHCSIVLQNPIDDDVKSTMHTRTRSGAQNSEMSLSAQWIAQFGRANTNHWTEPKRDPSRGRVSDQGTLLARGQSWRGPQRHPSELFRNYNHQFKNQLHNSAVFAKEVISHEAHRYQ
jgi:hypothetical protein